MGVRSLRDRGGRNFIQGDLTSRGSIQRAGGGGATVRLRPFQRAGGGGGGGGGWGAVRLRPIQRAGGGAVRLRPMQRAGGLSAVG